MKSIKSIVAAGAIIWCHVISAQTVATKLDQAVKNLMDTPAVYSANLSVYVSDENGKLVYEYNGNKGLSTASTQKIFTAACALETLGKEYRYTTTVSYSGNLSQGSLSGSLFVTSNGDPTLGSWRYESYKPENFKEKLIAALQEKGITSVDGDLVIDDSWFDFQTVPGGWPWNDMGNYYGAGVWGVNWRENQFDLKIRGNEVENSNVDMPGLSWVSELAVGGNSDQSLIFTAPHSEAALISGMLPEGKTMKVSGANPNPPLSLGTEISGWLKSAGIRFNGNIITTSGQKLKGEQTAVVPKGNVLLLYASPPLEKMIYWLMRKSVNLYGETFVKTLAREKTGEGSFDAGIRYMKNFWKGKGINAAMINFADGSGLSPQNYVSARAEVQALLYARKQPWFDVFYEGFPTQGNGMKMKSGTMKDTKSFAGYYKGYTFSIIINNYQGSNISDALYKILNTLK